MSCDQLPVVQYFNNGLRHRKRCLNVKIAHPPSLLCHLCVWSKVCANLPSPSQNISNFHTHTLELDLDKFLQRTVCRCFLYFSSAPSSLFHSISKRIPSISTHSSLVRQWTGKNISSSKVHNGACHISPVKWTSTPARIEFGDRASPHNPR